MERKTLRIKEAAALLGIQPTTLYAWVHTHKVPYHRHVGGKFTIFFEDELKEWVKSNSK